MKNFSKPPLHSAPCSQCSLAFCSSIPNLVNVMAGYYNCWTQKSTKYWCNHNNMHHCFVTCIILLPVFDAVFSHLYESCARCFGFMCPSNISQRKPLFLASWSVIQCSPTVAINQTSQWTILFRWHIFSLKIRMLSPYNIVHRYHFIKGDTIFPTSTLCFRIVPFTAESLFIWIYKFITGETVA
jgi:hypothetical protein